MGNHFTNMLRRIRDHPVIISAGLLLLLLGLWDKRAKILDFLTPYLQWIVELPSNLAWSWLFILFGLYLLGWGGRKNQNIRDKQAVETKRLIKEEIAIPLNVAREQRLDRELEILGPDIGRAMDKYQLLWSNLNDLEGTSGPVSRNEFRAKLEKPARELWTALDDALRHAKTFEEISIPTFPPTRIVSSNEHVYPERNRDFLDSLRTFVNEGNTFLEKLKRYKKNKHKELRKLTRIINEETERLLMNRD